MDLPSIGCIVAIRPTHAPHAIAQHLPCVDDPPPSVDRGVRHDQMLFPCSGRQGGAVRRRVAEGGSGDLRDRVPPRENIREEKDDREKTTEDEGRPNPDTTPKRDRSHGIVPHARCADLVTGAEPPSTGQRIECTALKALARPRAPRRGPPAFPLHPRRRNRALRP